MGRSPELYSRPYCGHTKEEVEGWIALKNLTGDNGRTLTWAQVSSRTGVAVEVMKSAAYRHRAGKRKGDCDRCIETVERVENLSYKYGTLVKIAEVLGKGRRALSNLANRAGLTADVRKQNARIGRYRQETLDITRERRGVVE